VRTQRFAILRLPAEIAKEDFKAIREVAREQTNLSEEELDEALDAKKMAGA
jgi:fumarate hydratase class II